jgi:DNA polymerase III epsilon subunit-like protein
MDLNSAYLREIVIDTETTGLDPLDGHRIVEIGVVELVSKGQLRPFKSLGKFPANIDPILPSWLRNAPIVLSENL